MAPFAAVLAIIAALALTVTKAVDFTRNLPWFKDRWVGTWVWNAVAFVYGVALCVGWQHSFVNDLLAQVPATASWHLTGTAGYLLSGLIVGGAAGFFHELLDALSSVANRNNTTVG